MPKNISLQETYENGLHYHHYANTAYPLTPLSFMKYKIKNQKEIVELLNEQWKKSEKICLYVHVPFCQVRCKFCEYAVLEGADEETQDEYVELLLKEIEMYKTVIGSKKIVGYDLGGGTPTRLSVENLKKITKAITSSFLIEEETIFSVETTPVIAAQDYDKIKSVYDMGYRRISMGIQTVSEKLLNDLGREGTTHIYETAALNIRKAGFNSFNVDLMYGFLHQSEEELENTLRYAIGLKPDHITLYRNRYKGTKLESEAGGVSLYKAMKQYQLCYEILCEHGYQANVGKNTFSRIENDYGTSDYLTQRVINGTPYLGMGLGAQSFGIDYLAYNDGAASKKFDIYRKKIMAGEFPIQDIYHLPLEESIAKMVSVAFYFGFVDLEAFKKRFEIEFEAYFKEEVAFVLEKGLMEIRDGRIILTERGADYINGVIPLFYSQHSKEELAALYKDSDTTVNGEQEYLKAYSQSKYERPSVAADMVVFSIRESRPDSYRTLGGKKLSVLLIKRGEHPYMNCWAIPGGFVRPNETVEQAAYRELREETGIREVTLRQLQVFSQPDRDKRGWVMSSSFMALAKSEKLQIASGDDAIDAKWFEVELEETNEPNRYTLNLTLEPEEEKEATVITALFQVANNGFEPGADDIQVIQSSGIAFDHAAIMALAIIRLRANLTNSGMAFAMMPDEFTLTELQRVYETILNEKYTPANFRRKIEPYVEETGNMVSGAGHRPAMLFRHKL